MYTTIGQDMRGHTSSEAFRLTTHTVQLCSNAEGKLMQEASTDYSVAEGLQHLVGNWVTRTTTAQYEMPICSAGFNVFKNCQLNPKRLLKLTTPIAPTGFQLKIFMQIIQ